MSWNFGDIFCAIGPLLGTEPALIHCAPGATAAGVPVPRSAARIVTWGELDRRTNALARALLDGGAKTGDKVAIYSYNRPEWIESLVACLKARLVPVNVNYRYRDEELHYLLDNSDSVAVIFEIRSRLSTDLASSRTTVLRCLTS